jgi:uncharacterized membrane protein (DUF485 family)
MTTPDLRHTPSAEEFIEAQQSPDFLELKQKRRGFTFPVCIVSLLWFLAYVLLALFAPGFYGTSLGGNFNVGFLMGLLQFVTTFAITSAYVKYADRVLEPLTEEVRDRLEHTGKYAESADAQPA